MNNLDAFLTMIAISEGTESLGDHGYNVLVGSTPTHPVLFESYADHPRKLVDLAHGLKSTAAGRYQILERYYDSYKDRLGLSDFSPASQDAIARQMIREHGALPDIERGDMVVSIEKCSPIWASLPFNLYGQHQNTIASLTEAFRNAGGLMKG